MLIGRLQRISAPGRDFRGSLCFMNLALGKKPWKEG